MNLNDAIAWAVHNSKTAIVHLCLASELTKEMDYVEKMIPPELILWRSHPLSERHEFMLVNESKIIFQPVEMNNQLKATSAWLN